MADTDVILTGKVTAILAFGAFVQLEDGTSGLVHISEISNEFVHDVKDYLHVGQAVTVMSLAVESDGKRKLSIRRVAGATYAGGDKTEKKEETRNRGYKQNAPRPSVDKRRVKPASTENKDTIFLAPPILYDESSDRNTGCFEDRLTKFMKESDEHLIDVKKQKENKRGGGYARRG